MAGPVTITCPGCREVFNLPTQVVKILGHTVLVRVDRSTAYGHMARCPGMAEPATPPKEASTTVAVPEVPQADLVGRIHLMLAKGAFMARGGSRACTMCGVAGDGCLSGLKLRKTACCGACMQGNTHPAPGESRGSCAEWGAEHGAKS